MYFNMKKLIIGRIIAEAFDVPFEALSDKTRERDVVEARHFAMWFYVNHEHLGKSRTAAKFKRHHATVIHALTTVDNLLQTDKGFIYKSNKALKALEEAGIIEPETAEV